MFFYTCIFFLCFLHCFMVSFLCLHLSPFCRYLSPHLHSIICSAPLFVSQSTSRSPRLPTCPLQFPIAVQSCPFSPASVPTPPLSPCSSLSGLLYSSQFCSLCPTSFKVTSLPFQAREKVRTGGGDKTMATLCNFWVITINNSPDIDQCPTV